jgi:hypothetical protein
MPPLSASDERQHAACRAREAGTAVELWREKSIKIGENSNILALSK